MVNRDRKETMMLKSVSSACAPTRDSFTIILHHQPFSRELQLPGWMLECTVLPCEYETLEQVAARYLQQNTVHLLFRR